MTTPAAPERLGADPSGRTFFGISVSSLADWPGVLTLASRYFVCLVVLGAPPETNQEVTRWAGMALGQGLVYACVWGPGCEAVHDGIDWELAALPDQERRSQVMTTWHDRDTLEEAANYFMVDAQPAPGYRPECSSWLVVEVARSGATLGARRLIADRVTGERNPAGRGCPKE